MDDPRVEGERWSMWPQYLHTTSIIGWSTPRGQKGNLLLRHGGGLADRTLGRLWPGPKTLGDRALLIEGEKAMMRWG